MLEDLTEQEPLWTGVMPVGIPVTAIKARLINNFFNIAHRCGLLLQKYNSGFGGDGGQ